MEHLLRTARDAIHPAPILATMPKSISPTSLEFIATIPNELFINLLQDAFLCPNSQYSVICSTMLTVLYLGTRETRSKVPVGLYYFTLESVYYCQSHISYGCWKLHVLKISVATFHRGVDILMFLSWVTKTH